MNPCAANASQLNIFDTLCYISGIRVVSEKYGSPMICLRTHTVSFKEIMSSFGLCVCVLLHVSQVSLYKNELRFVVAVGIKNPMVWL